MHLALLASIPSPSFNKIGPFNLYGLCIAAGVIAAVTISSKRWEARGGSADDIGNIALWAVPAGVIGARIYHVATDWKLYRDDWVNAFKITQGGLGIPGGIFFGVLAGVLVVRHYKLPMRPLLDVVAPAIPVAQAIGRLGNWFNQEVFGRPTGLPWGLKIDEAHRPLQYADRATFQPTFLYEGIWNLLLAWALVRLDKKRIIPPGYLFALYVLGYAMGRLWVENLRSDNASLILGLRINLWMSLVVGAIALAILLLGLRRSPLLIPESAYRDIPGRMDEVVDEVTPSATDADDEVSVAATADGDDDRAGGAESDADPPPAST